MAAIDGYTDPSNILESSKIVYTINPVIHPVSQATHSTLSIPATVAQRYLPKTSRIYGYEATLALLARFILQASDRVSWTILVLGSQLIGTTDYNCSASYHHRTDHRPDGQQICFEISMGVCTSGFAMGKRRSCRFSSRSQARSIQSLIMTEGLNGAPRIRSQRNSIFTQY